MNNVEQSATMRRYIWRYEVKRTRTVVASESLPPYETRPLADHHTVAAAFRAIVGDAPREHFLAFYVSSTLRIMGYETIAIGGTSSVEIEPAHVFRGALLAGAARLIVAHCHPSGDATPSESDLRLTRQLVDASRLIGIPLIDHVIVAANGVHSFVGAGRI